MRKALSAATAVMLAVAAPAFAQQTTLKLHHFLPAGSAANTTFIVPWCNTIAKDSGNRLKCQIYPSMQLGGTPPQLYDQVRDGVVDIIWTLPGYTAGRFPLVEVFELPFMMREPQGTSKALWDYVQHYAPNEFADVKLLATHVHGPGAFHTTSRQINSLADLKGMKIRAPTRQTNRLLAALGATPVAMPVPQVGEALAKGVIDGAAIPWDVVPSVKVQELARFHTETDPAAPALYTSTFIFAMNKAKYAALPPDLKRVIDANSGQALSGRIGRAFAEADIIGRKTVAASTINVIPRADLDAWVRLGQPVADAWVADISARGFDGKHLLEVARALIAKHTVR